MKGFASKGIQYTGEKWDDRQSRIEGWDAEAIRNATILVIGAGAIGNETLKNLALLGFGNVIVCDMDQIELSNLTRTVLFSHDDIGKGKSKLAAQKFLKMNMEPTAGADYFDGDIVYELGDGVFRRADIVLGCLDNVETRMYVNKICMRYDIPYIDAGISRLASNIMIMNGHDYGCYQCFAPKYKFEERFRNSCFVTMKKTETAGKAATVQTASAIVSGIQVQEALKIICNMSPQYGVEINYQGTVNRMISMGMQIDENCMCHMVDPRTTVICAPLSADDSLKDFLKFTGGLGFDRIELSDFEDHLRGFVPEVNCPCCGKKVRVFRPMFKVFMEDLFCEECREAGKTDSNLVDPAYLGVCTYTLAETPDEILDQPLRSLGIPYFHVLPVTNSESGETGFFELFGDMKKVLPSYTRKHAQ